MLRGVQLSSGIVAECGPKGPERALAHAYFGHWPPLAQHEATPWPKFGHSHKGFWPCLEEAILINYICSICCPFSDQKWLGEVGWEESLPLLCLG